MRETVVSSLAVSIGTVHGFYAEKPVLDVERLSVIRDRTPVPLVLHGASGLTDAQIKDCVREGICKVNIATELKDLYSRTVEGYLGEHPRTVDPKEYGSAGIEKVKELVKEKMLILGCDGKA